jgi:hypothetical protein
MSGLNTVMTNAASEYILENVYATGYRNGHFVGYFDGAQDAWREIFEMDVTSLAPHCYEEHSEVLENLEEILVLLKSDNNAVKIMVQQNGDKYNFFVQLQDYSYDGRIGLRRSFLQYLYEHGLNGGEYELYCLCMDEALPEGKGITVIR